MSSSSGSSIWDPFKHLWWRLFAKMINGQSPLNTFAKTESSIIHVWQSPEYASETVNNCSF